MSFETESLILMARPGPKTTVNLSVGVEEEGFDISGVPSTASPIYSASIRYQMFKDTSLSIVGARSISPSFFSNLVTTATSVTVALRQNLSPKLVLSVLGSYANDSYQDIEPGPLPKFFLGAPTTTALQVTRTDDTSSIGAGLNYSFSPRLYGSLYYTYSKNSGSQSEFTYNSSQILLQLAYHY
jgi:hypothetical protein